MSDGSEGLLTGVEEKGVSGIIVSVILILIVVGLGFSFLFFGEEVRQLVENQVRGGIAAQLAGLETGISVVDVNGDKVVVRNTGETVIETSEIDVFVDGREVDSFGRGEIEPGETESIELGVFQPGVREVRVTGPRGSVDEGEMPLALPGAVALWDFEEDGPVAVDSIDDFDGTVNGTTKLLYHMDGGSVVGGGFVDTVEDSSSNGNDGVFGGDPQRTAGISGNALEFDGSDDYVDVDYNGGDLEDWTVSGWIRKPTWDTFGRQEWLSVSESVDTSTKPLDFGYEDGKLKHWRGDAAGEVLSHNVSGRDGWIHMAVTQERISSTQVELEMYVNGQRVNTTTGDFEDMRPRETLNLGRMYNDNFHWPGTIDEVEIHSRALSPLEISNRFEEQEARFSEYVSAFSNQGFLFDGKSSVDVGRVLDGRGSFTVMAWTKNPQTSGDQDAVINGNGQLLISFDNANNQLDWRLGDGSGAWEVTTTTGVPSADDWHMVTATWDSDTDRFKGYVNKTQVVQEKADTFESLGSTPFTQKLGVAAKKSDGLWYEGEMDTVVVYDRALPSGEIGFIYEVSTSDPAELAGRDNLEPVAKFTVDCNGFSCFFNGTTSYDPDGIIEFWDWDFGDGNTGSGETTSHDYGGEEGVYTVNLTVTDDFGGRNMTSKELSLLRPEPRISMSCTRFTCDFSATRSSDPDGTVMNYTWDLGDGTVVEDENVTHDYGSPKAVYTVNLTATDDDGIKDWTTETFKLPRWTFYFDGFEDNTLSPWQNESLDEPWWHVTDHEGCINVWNGSYMASFSNENDCSYEGGARPLDNITEGIDVSAYENVTLKFDHFYDVGASDFREDVMLVEVSRDGGSTWEQVEEWNAKNDTNDDWRRNRLHVGRDYLPEDFEVRLRFDAVNELDNDNPGWYVDDVRLVGAGSAPRAVFNGSCDGLECTFNAENSTDPDGTVTSYEWAFGDGSTGSGEVVTHTYGEKAEYTVELNVTDDSGATDTMRKLAPFQPNVNFTVDCASFDCQFDASNSNDVDNDALVEYEWAFGDGSTGSGEVVTHDYEDQSLPDDGQGEYNATLTVTDEDGATNSTWGNLTLFRPVMNFTLVCDAYDCTFHGDDSYDQDPLYGQHGEIVDYSWEFGDGDSASSGDVDSISHSYAGDGVYEVNLTGTDNEQFKNSTAGDLPLLSPIAGFEIVSCNEDLKCEFDASESYDRDGVIENYTWDFGDGTLGSGEVVTHDYADEGEYVVTLNVTDDGKDGEFYDAEGITNTTSETVTVNPPEARMTIHCPHLTFRCTFNGSDSFMEGGSITGYDWKFGDGSTATGSTVTHTYGSAPGSDAPASPEAYWPVKADGTGTLHDESGNDRDGTLVGDASKVSDGGVLGDGLVFDGSDDSVDIDGWAGITGQQPRTWNIWFKSSRNVDHRLLSYGERSTGQKYEIRVDENHGGVLRVENEGGQLYGATDVTDGEWHALAVTCPDPCTDVHDHRLYVDGEEETNTGGSSQSLDTASTTDVWIGESHWHSGDTDGSVDEVRAYSRELSDSEISSLAGSGHYDTNLTVTNSLGTTNLEREELRIPHEILFEDGFESGSIDNTVKWKENLGSLWSITNGENCKEIRSGNYMLAYNGQEDLIDDCSYENTGNLTMNTTVDTSPYRGAVLMFDHYYQVEDDNTGVDAMVVDVSTDGGSSWAIIERWDARNHTNKDWQQVRIPMDDYLSSNMKIRFRFDTLGSLDNSYNGWFIDNVTIAGIAEPPTADFTFTCSGYDCSFDGSGSSDYDGSVQVWDWDFGDGNTGSGETTSHTYGSDGTYTIELTATDDDGLTDSVTDTVTFNSPVADFTYTCNNLECTFNASGSSDSDGSIQSYDWAFGDGTTGTGETVSHTYDSGGDYLVELTVTDDDGLQDSASEDLVWPIVNFTVQCTGLECEFDASRSHDTDGSIQSYDWTFGDGSTGTGEIVNHTYAGGGSYDVFLTVTDDDNLLNTTSPRSVTHGFFRITGTGQKTIDGVGFKPDVIKFEVTSTNENFDTESYAGSGQREFGWGHGFAHPAAGTDFAITAGSGSESTNGMAVATSDTYSIYQVITDDDGNSVTGWVEASVTGTHSDGFTIDVNRVDENQYVTYTAYRFGDSAEIDVGWFGTPTSTGTDSVTTGFQPNYLETVIQPNDAVSGMNQQATFSNQDADYGWGHGVAIERGGSIEQLSMMESMYVDDINHHLWGSSDRNTLYVTQMETDGQVTGRVNASLQSFDSNGFTLDYTEVDEDSLPVVYMAADTAVDADVGYVTTPTSTGTQTIGTDIGLGSVSLTASNTIATINDERIVGNNAGDGHHGWMLGGGVVDMQRAMGFSAHSNSINAHSSASNASAAFHLLYTDRDGNIVGRDQGDVTDISGSGFTIDWDKIATTADSTEIRYDTVLLGYRGFAPQDVIFNAPTANFTFSCSNLDCSFDGSGSEDPDGSLESWEWDFGDGSTGTGETVSHTYSSGGDYLVNLTVTDNIGVKDSVSEDLVWPTADFTVSCSGYDCTFDGSGSSDPDGSIQSYDWDFGDGNTGTGETVTHTYPGDGTYTVELNVTDNNNLKDATSQDVVLDTPTANFTFSCSNLDCSFDASGSSDSDGTVQSYDWDFGDGTTGSGETVTHTYSSGGDYLVNLTVTDDDGLQDSVSEDLVWPTADFTVSCSGYNCTFDGSGSSDPDGSVESWEWDFDGDGTIDATGQTVSHTYSGDGTYDATLTVTDNNNLEDSTTQTLVFDSPTADFTAICGSLTCRFDASGSSDSDGSIQSYDWDFGDGNTGTGEVVDHAYGSEGTYTVTLTVTDDDGLDDTQSKDVFVAITDVAVVDANDNDLIWYENDGTGSFTANTVANPTDPSDVVVEDLDGDGDQDLTASMYDGTAVAWWENDGTEAFTRHDIDTSADNPHGIDVADLKNDGDAHIDVAIAEHQSGDASGGREVWYENDGTESFTRHNLASDDQNPRMVRAADLDGDGDTDLASSRGWQGDETVWMENDGSGGFTTHTLDTGGDPGGLAVGDITGNGAIDIVNGMDDRSRIYWHENDGTGSFTRHSISTGEDGWRTHAVADVDGDGHTDIIGGSKSSNTLSWWENDGTESFTRHDIDTSISNPKGVKGVYLTNDPYLDIVVSASGDGTLHWYENDGTGSFTTHSIDSNMNNPRGTGAGPIGTG